MLSTPLKKKRNYDHITPSKLPLVNSHHINLFDWSLDSDCVPHSEENLLRKFDLDSRFGPCRGVSREQRWLRATNLGLNPPHHIFQLIKSSGNSQSVIDFHCAKIAAPK